MKLTGIIVFLLSISLSVLAQEKSVTKHSRKTKQTVHIVKASAFKVLKTDANARKVMASDFLLINIEGKLESNDSLLFDSYKTKPYDIPANEPTMKTFLLKLKQGDSAIFSVVADSLFRNSFGRDLPQGIQKGDIINFTLSVVEVSTKEERAQLQEAAMRKQQEKKFELITKDSIESIAFIKTLTDVKVTSTGLKYSVIKSTSGRQVVKGDKISVSYKGSFLDGRIFDESKEGQPPFTFEIGSGQVIQGWDEGLLLMKEGDHFKFVIPWQLAYGTTGQGPIPAFTTLVFDVKLNKIN